MSSLLPRVVGRLALAIAALPAAWAGNTPPPTDAGIQKPDKPPPGFFQVVTPAFVIETDVSKSYSDQLARQVFSAEKRMYELFQISDGFLRGNDPKSKLGKYGISGDQLSKWGFKPFIEIRVFKTFEDFADEYFNESDRLESLVNKTQIKKETPEQRATRRMTEGVPGAYYMRIRDYDGKYTLRRIRAFVASHSPEEVEADLLHELGHLFLETYLFEFAGAPKKGNESEKRGTPAWMGEGVAQLFGINWASSHEARKQKARQSALIYEAVKLGDHYPFDKFVNVTNAHNLLAVAGDPLKSTINYAQSFSVTQYMVECNWQMYLNFLDNCRAYNLRENAKTPNRTSELYSLQDRAFKDAFTVPISEVEKTWKDYVIKTQEKELKKNPAGYYWCGEYYLLRKEVDKAEERYKLAVEGAPNAGEGFLGMGRVALMKRDVPGALTHLTKAAELSPKNEDAFYYLGQAQTAAGKHPEAIASLKRAVEIFPRFHQAHYELADAYFEAGDFKNAVASYDAAFRIESNNPHYLFAKGRAAFFGHEYEEAQRNFAAFTNIFPKDPQGLFWYGMAAWRMALAEPANTVQRDFALKKLEDALKLAPNQALFKQGLEYAKRGETLRFEREGPASKLIVKPPEKKDEKPPEKGTKPVNKKDED